MLEPQKGVNDFTLYIGVTPFATIAEEVASFAIITVRANVYICVGVVGYGTIAKESNIQRYIKGLTVVPYIRRLTVSTYISENATVVTYKKGGRNREYIILQHRTTSTYFSRRLPPRSIYAVVLRYYIRVHTNRIYVPPHTDRHSYLHDPATPLYNAIKTKKKKETKK